jgi:hypothetical protein
MLLLGGGTRRGNSYLLDGVPISDIFNRAAIQPSVEALEEVKVQVSTYAAEMGRTAGGVFNATQPGCSPRDDVRQELRGRLAIAGTAAVECASSERPSQDT